MADITVLAFPEVTSDDGDGIIYLIQGTGATRDKKIQVKNLIGNTLEVTATGSVDLSSYGADLVLFANSGAAITITFSNYLGAGKQIQIVGVGAGLVTLAGTITDVVIQNEVRKHVSSGTAFYNRDNANLKVDTISERTAGSGVTIDSVALKDSAIKTDGTFLRTRVVNIGDWNMDTDNFKNVSHGFLGSYFSTIRKVDVMIIADSGALLLLDNVTTETNPAIQGVIGAFTSSVIQLFRTTGGFFDASGFSSIAINRGTITITYEV